MLALYRPGRQADALAAYRAVRCSLVEDLGLEPGPQLRRLEAAVLAQDPAVALLAAASVVTGVALTSGEASMRRAIMADGAGAVDPATGHVTAATADPSSGKSAMTGTPA